jgi:hypothetical protein
MHGPTTSDVEVTNVSSHGFWMLAGGRELFLAFDDFPWFRDASIAQITGVQEVRPGHFRWPALDVDLDIKSIEDPERYPLVAR